MNMNRGSWVTNTQQIGRVKHIHNDGFIDIIVYDRFGNVIGRTSPAMGGPTSFEPCCNPDNWKEIFEPEFPLTAHDYIKNIVRFAP